MCIRDRNQAEIARDLGKEGTKWYAGAITTVTGGQGMDKLVSATGASGATAAIVDMTLTVTEKQPLDLLGKNVECAITSRATETAIVDPAKETLTPARSKSILRDSISRGISSQEEVENAADSLGAKIADDNKDDLGTSKGYDGSRRVAIPQKVHVQDAGEVKNEGAVKVRDIGRSDVLVTTRDTAPDIVTGVDLGDDVVELEMTPLVKLERGCAPIDIVFCIDVTGSMWDDIAEVVSSATGMLLSVAMRTDNYRIGFVLFRDIEVDSVPFERMPFSSDRQQILANIGVLPGKVHGGGDWPESVLSLIHI